MGKYIDKEELIREIISDMALFEGTYTEIKKHDEYCNYAVKCVSKAPEADVTAVIHGHWNIMDDIKTRCICSKCEWDVPEYGKYYSYCPNCGAKMYRGDEK